MISILLLVIQLIAVITPYAFSFNLLSTTATTTTSHTISMSTDKIVLEIKKAESLFIIPALTVPLFEIEKLRGLMTGKKMATVNKDKLLMSIDGTYFCQAADYITDLSNICIIGSEGETDEIMDTYMSWTR